MIWLLDTNTIIYALKYEGGAREKINLAGLRGEPLVTSAVVAAELLAAAALDVGATLVTHDGDFDPKDMPADLKIDDWYG